MDEITTNISEIVNKEYKATLSYIVWRVYNDSKKEYESSGDVLVTEHTMMNGKPGAARAISQKSLLELCSLVMPKIKKPPVFLPPEILGYSPTSETIIWWKKPSPENLFFTQEEMKNGKAPVPGLVFQVTRRTMSLWALESNERPEPKTELYHAPFFNVSNGVCMGNVPLPRSATPGNYHEWERAFFNSAFSHDWSPPLNGTTPKKLWQGLVNSNAQEFPIECLTKVPKGARTLTLADILSDEW